MSMHIHSGTPPLVSGAMARIERRLPQPGKVTVRVGQRVEPEDVVAHCFLPGTPHIINLSRALMIAPAQIERAMRLEIGNKVTQGEVLARTSRVSGRVCLAPVSGEIVSVDAETGYVTIVSDPVRYELQANVRGVVMEELPHEGVRIETPAAQVFGAFGFGEERSGVLRLLVTDPSEPILPEMIDARSAYAIVIGGSGVTAAALRRAAQGNVRGVIVGSIDEGELRAFLGYESVAQWRSGVRSWQFPALPDATQSPLTVVITEGFGSQPMSTPLFELLASHDRQEAFIEGMTHLRRPLHRPRVVVPLSSRTPGLQLEPPSVSLRPGAMVRLLDSAHLGMVGKVRQVPVNPRRMASRSQAEAVEVVVDDGSSLLVPRTAVEVLN
jgi:hypothetical protein